jgi:tetratricopeptide (TPR) repeat protein
MLETVREYARKALDATGETGTLQTRHAMHYLRVAEEAGPNIRQPSNRMWITRLEAEYDNISVALHWSAAHSASTGLRIVGALGWYWQLNSTYRDGVDWLQRMLAKAGEEALAEAEALPVDDMRIKANALYSGAKLGRWCGELDIAWSWIEESVRLLREIGEQSTGLVDALTVYMPLAYLRGKVTREEEVAGIEETLALARRLGDKWGESQLLTGLGLRALWSGDYERAAAYFSENLTLARELDNRQHIAGALINLGDVMRLTGEWEQAGALYGEALALGRREGIVWAESIGLTNMARVRLQRGETKEARKLLAESLEASGDKQLLLDRAWTLVLLVWVLLDEGETEQACRLLGATTVLLNTVGPDAAAARLADIKEVVQRVAPLLEEPGHRRLWDDGRSLDFQQTAALALQAARS